MRRSAYLGAMFIGFVVGFLLFFPLSCWQADCPPAFEICRAGGCGNALGMTFDSRNLPIGVLGGFAGALLLVLLFGLLVKVLDQQSSMSAPEP